jgi:hypothetical protein
VSVRNGMLPSTVASAAALVTFLQQEQQQQQQQRGSSLPSLFRLCLSQKELGCSAAAAYEKVAGLCRQPDKELFSLLPGLVDRLVSQAVGQEVKVVIKKASQPGQKRMSTTCAAYVEHHCGSTWGSFPFFWEKPGDGNRNQQYHYMSHVARDQGVGDPNLVDNYAGLELDWHKAAADAAAGRAGHFTSKFLEEWERQGGLLPNMSPGPAALISEMMEGARQNLPDADAMAPSDIARMLQSRGLGDMAAAVGASVRGAGAAGGWCTTPEAAAAATAAAAAAGAAAARAAAQAPPSAAARGPSGSSSSSAGRSTARATPAAAAAAAEEVSTLYIHRMSEGTAGGEPTWTTTVIPGSSSSSSASGTSSTPTAPPRPSRPCAQCKQLFPKLHRCTRCKAVSYCSKQCQVAHWKAGHKEACIPKDV